MRLQNKSLVAPGGPLGVFSEYPILLRLGLICVCAEIGWAILIIVLQFHFMDDLLRGEAKQLIASRIASATLAFVAAETLFKIPMGSLADRYGPRPLIFFALSISELSPLCMMLFAHEWYHFIPLRAMDGLGAAALWPAMSSLMARSVPREAKASAMSVFNGASCLGLAAGPMTGLFLAHRFGNRAVFPLCTTLMIVGLLIAWRVLRGGIGSRAEALAKVGSEHGVHHIGEQFPQRESTLLRGRPMLVRMMVLYAVSQCAVGLLANTMLPYIKGQFNLEEGDLPKMIALPALAVAFMALPLGRVADSIGRPQAVWISYVMAVLGMTGIALTSLFEPTRNMFSPQIVLFGAGLLLMVGSYILGTPAWLGLTSVQVEDSRQAQALSLMQTSQGVGVVIGSALVASIGHLLTSWERFGQRVGDRIGGHLGHALAHGNERFLHKTQSLVSIDMWLWIASGLFLICLLGTLVWVREPEHDATAEDAAQIAKQPLEITGV
jgi:DHA1 family multidrug resistance protein-like MFS transporter